MKGLEMEDRTGWRRTEGKTRKIDKKKEENDGPEYLTSECISPQHDPMSKLFTERIISH